MTNEPEGANVNEGTRAMERERESKNEEALIIERHWKKERRKLFLVTFWLKYTI